MRTHLWLCGIAGFCFLQTHDCGCDAVQDGKPATKRYADLNDRTHRSKGWHEIVPGLGNPRDTKPRDGEVNKPYAPTPIFRPRIGFFKVEPAMSQFRVMTALRPSVSDAVTECSPSPKGRPVGPRAQRSNGISSLAFISCLLHIQMPLRVWRCPTPNASSRCCSSQNISPALGTTHARRCNLLGTHSRTSPSTTITR
jgi:hypothetical protein